MKIEAIKTVELEHVDYSLHYDEDAQSPDTWNDESLFLMASHRSLSVRHDQTTEDNVSALQKTHHLFPVEAYIHSGIRLYFAKEAKVDRAFDVSALGFICASKSEFKTRAKAKNAATGLLEEWNQYLSGEVYGYEVKDKDGLHLESCYGFFGADGREDAEKEARRFAIKHNAERAIVAGTLAAELKQARKIVAEYVPEELCEKVLRFMAA